MENTSKSYRAPGKSVMENAHDVAETPKRILQGKEWRNQAPNSSFSGDSDRADSVFNGPTWARKKGGKVKRADGGPVKGTKDGAGGGMGREEKIKMYGKGPGKVTGYSK